MLGVGGGGGGGGGVGGGVGGVGVVVVDVVVVVVVVVVAAALLAPRLLRVSADARPFLSRCLLCLVVHFLAHLLFISTVYHCIHLFSSSSFLATV